MLPLVQITICTWNRAELLRQTLESACALARPDTQRVAFLVINNNSTDTTSYVVRGFANRLPIREIFEPVPGHTVARNRALAESDADFVLWTDDDVRFDRNWLTAFCDATVRWPDGSIYGGPCQPWFPHPPDSDLVAMFPALARGYCVRGYDGDDGPIAQFDPQHVMGMNFGVRMARLRHLRFDTSIGYSPSSITGGDETEYITRALAEGARVVWVSRMHVQHYVAPERMTLGYLKRFTIGNARRAARDSSEASRSVLTLARWCAGEYAAYFRDRSVGRRRHALGHLKRGWHLRGLIAGLRESKAAS